MSIQIPRRWGMPGIIEALRTVLRLDAKFRSVILRILSGEERVRYIAVIAAIQLLFEVFPIPGADDDPGTTT